MTTIERDRANSGYLYPNTKRTSPEDPSHTGRIHIGGVRHDVVAWTVRDPGSKMDYISLQVLRPAQLDLLDAAPQ